MDYYVSNCDDLNFYGCGNLVCNDNFLHNKRTLGCNVLIFVLEGNLNICVDNKPFNIQSSELVFLPKNIQHFGEISSKGRLSYFWVHFDTKTSFEKVRKLDLSQNYAFIIPEYSKALGFKRISLLFSQLIDLSLHKNPYRNDLSLCALRLLLMEISQQSVEHNFSDAPASPKVSAIAKYIKENCQRDISISEIASEFCYNSQYLSTLFKKHQGISITGFINKCRLEISKGLLCDSMMSVKKIAYTCGFSDEKYFMRLFKKSEGITPLEYRNAFGQKFINSQKD